jgi:hypothetical protein
MSSKRGKKARVFKKNHQKTYWFAEDHIILTISQHSFSRLLQQLVTDSVTPKIDISEFRLKLASRTKNR